MVQKNLRILCTGLHVETASIPSKTTKHDRIIVPWIGISCHDRILPIVSKVGVGSVVDHTHPFTLVHVEDAVLVGGEEHILCIMHFNSITL